PLVKSWQALHFTATFSPAAGSAAAISFSASSPPAAAGAAAASRCAPASGCAAACGCASAGAAAACLASSSSLLISSGGRGASGLGAEPGDDVGAVLRLRQAREGHLGARREALRVGDEVVDVLVGPGGLQALDRVVVVEVFLMRGRAAEHAVEVRAHLVLLA